ncbi:MAG: hypothetical protein LUM44_05125 [Pyrinomonadaceae bacterium]|nr:hypothetical protein [Pyrinomonadaceae bacterium]
MKFDETKIRKYLLDDLSLAETEAFELQMLEDSDAETSLALCEHELIEDFIDEKLSSSERELFQKNFLVSNRRKEELEFLQSLKIHSAKSFDNKKKVKEKPSFGETLSAFFRRRPFQIAFASFAVLILVVGIWRFSGNFTKSELAKETSALNETNLSDISAYQSAQILTLIPGVFRGNDAAQSISKGNSNQPLLLRLALQGNYSAKPTAELYREENLLVTLKDVPIHQNTAGSEVRLLLPSARLDKGNYRLELLFGNEKTVYNFAVE